MCHRLIRGAYASRQSFVTGTAVRHCAEILRDKILAYAKTLLPGNRHQRTDT